MGDMVHIAVALVTLGVTAGVVYQLVNNPTGTNALVSATTGAIATDTRALSGR